MLEFIKIFMTSDDGSRGMKFAVYNNYYSLEKMINRRNQMDSIPEVTLSR
ncbi:MAG: hypothetical protein UH239_05910 [Acutalibacteraceae bacterium]|nr:hypothetical protein [Acutalibacteraceae bacterium]